MITTNTAIQKGSFTILGNPKRQTRYQEINHTGCGFFKSIEL